MTKTFQIENGVLNVFEGVTELENEMFAENSEIEKVILPEGMTSISAACFYLCDNLKEIVIPSTVRIIKEGAFLYCSELEDVHLPDGLEEIEDLAFQCSGLRKITIPEAVKSIGEEAFFDCKDLVEANVLGRNTMICDDAFGSDYSLVRGYMAPGFPPNLVPGSELQYSLLWASCPDKHSDEVSERAMNFIRNNEMLVMERIFKFNNTAAMSGISKYQLLSKNKIDDYVKHANDEDLTELTALLIKCKGNDRNFEDEFAL